MESKEFESEAWHICKLKFHCRMNIDLFRTSLELTFLKGFRNRLRSDSKLSESNSPHELIHLSNLHLRHFSPTSSLHNSCTSSGDLSMNLHQCSVNNELKIKFCKKCWPSKSILKMRAKEVGKTIDVSSDWFWLFFSTLLLTWFDSALFVRLSFLVTKLLPQTMTCRSTLTIVCAVLIEHCLYTSTSFGWICSPFCKRARDDKVKL